MPRQQTNLHSATLREKKIQSIEISTGPSRNHNPDLLYEVCTPDWQDIPLAPGQAPGPEGLKYQIVFVFLKTFPDLELIVLEPSAHPAALVCVPASPARISAR